MVSRYVLPSCDSKGLILLNPKTSVLFPVSIPSLGAKDKTDLCETVPGTTEGESRVRLGLEVPTFVTPRKRTCREPFRVLVQCSS